MVIDVRAGARIKAADAEAFAVTAAACARLGWEFRRAGEIDPVPGSNVRWLARYRHPRCAGRAEAGRRLREAFAGPAPLLHLAAVSGLDPKTAIRYAENARLLLTTRAEEQDPAHTREPKGHNEP